LCYTLSGNTKGGGGGGTNYQLQSNKFSNVKNGKKRKQDTRPLRGKYRDGGGGTALEKKHAIVDPQEMMEKREGEKQHQGNPLKRNSATYS